jgi:predicted permease
MGADHGDSGTIPDARRGIAMRALRGFSMRLGELFGKERRDREFAEELESHLQMHIEDNLRAGMTPREARRQALVKLGGIEQTKESYRERRGVLWLESLLQDVRFGLRMLRKNPGFTSIAMLTLALGIGANTAIFSIVDAVLLDPIPFPQPDRLVNLHERTSLLPDSTISYPNYLDWQRESNSFEGIGVWRVDDFTFTGSGEPERLRGKMISSNLFSVLGVQPILGRTFRPEEDQLGAAPVALISEGLWKRHFGSDPSIIGKSIALNGKSYSVVGVIPSNFHLVRFDNSFFDDVFLPVGQWDSTLLRNRSFRLGLEGIARLKPSATLVQARNDMNQVAANLRKAYPNDEAGITMIVAPIKDEVAGDLRPALLVLLGAVGFVLLIACANVANLQLARSMGRAREFAIRAALGASRRRIIRQLLIEGLLLAFAGGMLGIVLATSGMRSILNIFPSALPAIVHVEMNRKVLFAAIAISFVTGILFGLAPALRTSDVNLYGPLREGPRGSTTRQHRTQNVLVAIEIGLALMLLIAAGLLIRSFERVWAVNPGFDPHGILTFGTGLSSANNSNPEKTRAVLHELGDKAAAIPGVQAASVDLGALPFSGNSGFPFWPDDQPKPSAIVQWHFAVFFPVGPDYLRVMQIPLILGRNFTEHDAHSAPTVVLVDQDLADSTFPGQDPIGKRLAIGPQWSAEIVGVVGHVTQTGLDTEAKAPMRAQMYLPYVQLPDFYLQAAAKSPSLVVRSSVRPLSILGSLQREIGDLDPNDVVYDARTMDDLISGSLAERRFSMVLLSTFAAIALSLAMIGIYGVVAYVVSQRTLEIGIRVALGAQRRDILRIVLSHAVGMALVGIASGLAASFGLTRLLTKLLFNVSPTDPLTFAAVVVILLCVVLLACWIPAWRAMRVDPMVALRYE